MSGRGSSRGGSALPRSSVRPGFGGGVRPGTLTLNLRPSLVVSSSGFGSSGSPGIGLMGLRLLLIGVNAEAEQVDRGLEELPVDAVPQKRRGSIGLDQIPQPVDDQCRV